MDEFALAKCFVFPPLSDVLGAIRPRLRAETVSESTFPLSFIDSSRFESVRLSFLSGFFEAALPRRYCLCEFSESEVLGRANLFAPHLGHLPSGQIASEPSLYLNDELHIGVEKIFYFSVFHIFLNYFLELLSGHLPHVARRLQGDCRLIKED
jgi:hypothetical protein